MTEIQWLVDIMLNCKLPTAVKDKFIARIGEVEAQLKPAFQPRPQINSTIQAPSMQRIMDEISMESIPAPQPRKIIPQEVVTSSGNGTMIKGPRKF